MKEIAERVGVSKTTVHRALSGKGRVSEATRSRILEVAAELDYTPNILARSLRRQKTGTIGVLASGVNSSFYGSLLDAVEEAASGQGFSILLACSSGSRDLERTHLNVMREKRVDGLLISPAHPGANVADYTRLQKAALPFVFVDRVVRAVAADAVMTDHHLAGGMIAAHLAAGGRRKIGIIMPLDERKLATGVQERVAGLLETAARTGAEVVRIGRDRPWDPLEDYAAHCLGEFLDKGGDVDSLFCVNDNMALGALWALQARGLDVPEQVAVVGYDDLDISSFVTPRLTTIRQPTRQIAWEAVKILIARMGGARPDEPVIVRLRPTLMERESTPAVHHAPAPLTPPEDG